MANEMDTKAAVGMLTAGSFGITHALGLSCANVTDLAKNWDILRMCQHWRIRAAYRPDSAVLTLRGWGDPVPIMAPVDGRRLCMVPTYEGEWEIDDPDAVRFFMAGCKRDGYFALLPALNMEADLTRRPLLAFLKGKGGVS